MSDNTMVTHACCWMVLASALVARGAAADEPSPPPGDASESPEASAESTAAEDDADAGHAPAPKPTAPAGYHAGYGPGYGPRYGAGGASPPPRELELVEGAAVPDGYVVESRINKGLVIAGATTLGAVYLLTTLGAAIAVDTSSNPEAYEPLFIPVAGPFVTIHTADANATGTFGLVLDGLAQTAGLSMFVAGLVAQEEVLVWRGHGMTVAPTAGPTGAGLTGSF